MADHDHAAKVAMFGECPICAATADLQPMNDGRPVPDFDGGTYRRAFDHRRLAGQLRRVYDAMADGAWHTLAELADAADAPEASVSARLRDLRKDEFGGFVVEHRRRGDPRHGVWEYRLPEPLNPASGGSM